MMKLLKYIFVILLLVRCTSYKVVDSKIQKDTSTIEIDSYLFVEDGVFVNKNYFTSTLACDKKLDSVTDTVYFITDFQIHNHVEKCVKPDVYNGNAEAETFLADFLRTLKDRYFQYTPKGYRGEKVFLALLDLASSLECADDEYSTKFGNAPLKAIYEMVKSYDGYEKFMDFRRNTLLINEIDVKSNDDYECYGLAATVTYSSLIKLAWEKGVIILKDYGEK